MECSLICIILQNKRGKTSLVSTLSANVLVLPTPCEWGGRHCCDGYDHPIPVGESSEAQRNIVISIQLVYTLSDQVLIGTCSEGYREQEPTILSGAYLSTVGRRNGLSLSNEAITGVPEAGGGSCSAGWVPVTSADRQSRAARRAPPWAASARQTAETLQPPGPYISGPAGRRRCLLEVQGAPEQERASICSGHLQRLPSAPRAAAPQNTAHR